MQDGKGNEQGQQLGVLKQGFQHVLDGYPGRTGGTLTNGKILALRQTGNVAQSPGHGKHEDQGDDKVVPAAKGKLCDQRGDERANQHDHGVLANHVNGHGVPVGGVGSGNHGDNAVVGGLNDVHQTVQDGVGNAQNRDTDNHGCSAGVRDLQHNHDSQYPAAIVQPGLMFALFTQLDFLNDDTAEKADDKIADLGDQQCRGKGGGWDFQDFRGEGVQVHEADHDGQGQQRIGTHGPYLFFTACRLHNSSS